MTPLDTSSMNPKESQISFQVPGDDNTITKSDKKGITLVDKIRLESDLHAISMRKRA